MATSSQQANSPDVVESQVQRRTRASAACRACRARRCKCVMQDGNVVCDRCRRLDLECITHDVDERKRPSSKAYVSLLSRRIEHLEGLLEQAGQEVPPLMEDVPEDRRRWTDLQGVKSAPVSKKPRLDEEAHRPSTGAELDVDSESPALRAHPEINPPEIRPTRQQLAATATKSSSQENRALPKPLHNLEGAISSWYNIGTPSNMLLPGQKISQVEDFLAKYTADENQCLVDAYFSGFNSIFPVIRESAFRADCKSGSRKHYSGFLHFCILAIGLRYADKNLYRFKNFALESQESLLHHQARRLFDGGSETFSGITGAQSLLLLSDLEFSVGRMHSGSLLSNKASQLIRYCLNVSYDDSVESSKQDLETLLVILATCTMYSTFWSNVDDESSMMMTVMPSAESTRLTAELCRRRRRFKSNSSENVHMTYAWSSLAILCRTIAVEMRSASFTTLQSCHTTLANLDSSLNDWYVSLTDYLRWLPANLLSASSRFYLLHQQYHSSVIMLHKLFIKRTEKYREAQSETPPDFHFSRETSESVCRKNACRIAEIFQERSQNAATANSNGGILVELQHISNAVTVLVSSLNSQRSNQSRNKEEDVQHLRILHQAIFGLSQIFPAARSMADIVRQILKRADSGSLRGSQENQESAATSDPEGSPSLSESQKRRNTGSFESSMSFRPLSSSLDGALSHENGVNFNHLRANGVVSDFASHSMLMTSTSTDSPPISAEHTSPNLLAAINVTHSVAKEEYPYTIPERPNELQADFDQLHGFNIFGSK